jgi:hypothetical protein
MSYTGEHFEYISARELLENPRRWIAGNSGEFDIYVAHKVSKVEEVDNSIYINYIMREGVQDFHQERRDWFRVTRVDFVGSKPSVQVELRVPPDKQIFVLKREFEPKGKR